jgi:hypothetical protein
MVPIQIDSDDSMHPFIIIQQTLSCMMQILQLMAEAYACFEVIARTWHSIISCMLFTRCHSCKLDRVDAAGSHVTGTLLLDSF